MEGFPRSDRNAGFSLVEAMVVTGIVSLGALFGAQLLVGQARSAKSNRNLIERDSIESRIAHLIGDGPSLEKSANSYGSYAGNVNFKNCVVGGGTCSASSDTDFYLTDGGGVLAAGPASAPVYYDTYGRQCGTPSPDCTIEVSTRFAPTCAGGATSCTIAQSVTVSYKIQQAPGITNPSGTPLATRTNNVVNQVPLRLLASGIVGRIPYWSTTTALSSSTISQDGAGKIGVNQATPTAQLDVNGEARLGNSGVACSSTNEGAVRYNSATKRIEFCDGTGWKSTGGQAYVAWGTACASGYASAYTGYATIAVYYGNAAGTPICKSGGPIGGNAGGFFWGTGTTSASSTLVEFPCDMCVSGGNYTAWGTTSCASGYTVAYVGFAVIPFYTNFVAATPICKNGLFLDPVGFFWSSGTRHQQTDIGCAVCVN